MNGMIIAVILEVGFGCRCRSEFGLEIGIGRWINAK